jgi:XTP/dITP diphosphohydrolase
MTTLLLATRNAHKAGEIRAILGPGFRHLTLDDYPGAPEVIEDAGTFAGNATKKATELANWLSRSAPTHRRPVPDFVLADDSGLEVDALAGQPGVHSARFAALDSGQPGNSPDADNNAKLLRLLQEVPTGKRTARFRCLLALVAITQPSALRPPHLFDGACEGRILFLASGLGGFGYDPLFKPDGSDGSFAELGEAFKNQISHRARALQKLKAHILVQP